MPLEGIQNIQGGMHMFNFNVNPNHQAQVNASTNSAINKTAHKQPKESEQEKIPTDSYEAQKVKQNDNKAYTVDLEKVRAMKEEADLRMIELFRTTAKQTTEKQISGPRSDSSIMTLKLTEELSIEYTAEDVEQAQKDLAPGGYWSADETSTRLVDFAKALSGGDPAKAAMLKDAFEQGFKEIEKMFGGTLPDISYETYNLTMEKFDQWANETE
jgi:anti-sigma28 factor (negative regulator of flagellin synthesis)